MYLDYYLEQLGSLPDFLIKYLSVPSLLRLKRVGYFCGMDFASNEIYNFNEYISRYDHSLTVALIVFKLTGNKKATLAGLFHDISTPCFSHVIDYMNGDLEKQESTEEYTEEILRNDKYLKKCLEEDGIDLDDIVDFKKYTVVDNDRPKVCADRIDGVILTGIGWTKNVSYEDIKNIVSDMCIFINEFNEYEIGFKTMSVAQKVLAVSESIDVFCHTKEDNYMMQLLAKITKLAIDKEYISYKDLFTYHEKRILRLLNSKKDEELKKLLYMFYNMTIDEVPEIELPNVKARSLNPLVNNKRMK